MSPACALRLVELLLRMQLALAQFRRSLVVLGQCGRLLLRGDAGKLALQHRHRLRADQPTLDGIQPQGGSRLVHDIDGFIRQEAVIDVTVRELHRRLDGLV